MFEDKKICAIVPAAGSGSRMGSHRPKQLLEINGKPIIVHTLQALNSSPEIDCIVLVVGNEKIEYFKQMASVEGISKICNIVGGGDLRQDSIWNGLQTLRNEHIDIVVVHDAVRPFVTPEMIRAVCASASEDGASIVAVRSKDTVKILNDSGSIELTPQRENVWIAQTPQAFRFSLLFKAYEKAVEEKFYGTDDASLVEHAGCKVKIVEGHYDNIKITTPEDLELASLIAHRRK